MTIDMSQLAPYIWFIGAILAILLIFVVIRFFWHHVLRYLLQGCLVIVGIIILVLILKYFKVI